MSKLCARLLLAVALVLVPAATSLAATLSNVSVADINLERTTFNEGDTITGMFSLLNREQSVANDIGYEFNLFLVAADGTKSMIGTSATPARLSLLPGELATPQIDYLVPSNAPQGSYIFQIRVVNGKGVKLGWKDVPIMINSSRTIAHLSNPKLFVPGITLAAAPLAGPTIAPGKAPEISFIASNPSDIPMSLTVHMTVYKRSEQGERIAQSADMHVAIAGKASRAITIATPVISEPESYLARIALVDGQGNPSSNYLVYRWVIGGQSAKILSMDISTAQPESRYCSSLPVSVVYTPLSADGIPRPAELALGLTVKDEQGKTVGTSQMTLPKDQSSVIVPIALSNCVETPEISAVLTSGGVTLDSYEVRTKSAEPSSGQKPAATQNAIFTLLAVAAVLVGGFLYMRRSGSGGMSVFFMALAFAGTGAIVTVPTRVAHADSSGMHVIYDYMTYNGQRQGDYSDLTTYWNEPAEGSKFNRNDKIDISFSVHLIKCFNLVDQDKTSMTLYWADANGNIISQIKSFDPDSKKHYTYDDTYEVKNVSIPQSLSTGPARILLKSHIKADCDPSNYCPNQQNHFEYFFSGYVNVTIFGPTPSPTASLSSNPSSITRGQSSTLTWGSTNATSCTGSGFSTGGARSGSRSVMSSQTTNYGVTCTNGNRSATANTTVTVNSSSCVANAGSTCVSAANSCGMTGRGTIQCNGLCSASTPPVNLCPVPALAIVVTPGVVQEGATVTVRWSSRNTTNCRVSGTDGFTGTGSNGTALDGPLAAQTIIYTLTCKNAFDPSQTLTAKTKLVVQHITEA